MTVRPACFWVRLFAITTRTHPLHLAVLSKTAMFYLSPTRQALGKIIHPVGY